MLEFFSVGLVISELAILLSLARAGEIFIQNPADFVLPFIGTTDGGHVFPGATLPHGMIKAGMDTTSPGNQAGYDADPQYDAIGFSQMHDSGTGGSASLSNFKIWPFASCPSFTKCPTDLFNRAVPRKLLPDGSPDDVASPGYFASNLSTDIRVELTTTRRTALHRYTFPANSSHPRLLVDLTNDGQQSGYDVTLDLDPSTGRVTGDAWFEGSFGPGAYHLFTCVDFHGDGYNFTGPTEYGSWFFNTVTQNATNLSGIYSGSSGGLLTFPPANHGSTSILVRVGVSFISSAQACANAEEEIPDWNFNRVRSDALDQWNELLQRVQVDPTGVDEETVQLFYSSLYRTHIVPADYTGENPRWKSSEPYYDSYYCNWDTFRTLYPLFSLHDPSRFALITRAMIDVWRFEGWLPECRGATLQQWVQGGSNADPILGEFFVKYHGQATALNVSVSDLYNALITDSESEPDDWDLQGRQANAWVQFDYIPDELSIDFRGTPTRQASKTLEHAFGDFAISQVAKILNKTDDAAELVKRANGSFNLWNPAVSLPGFPSVTGFIQLKNSEGVFDQPTDPRHCSVNDPTHSTCFLDPSNHDGFYESSPMVYSQFVPHDVAQLITFQGGQEAFIERLNIIFNQSYFDVTDEPSQQIPFMYHYANRPGLSTKQSRQVLLESYNTSVNGLPGNDDSGAMGSFAVFLLAGLYPVPATRQYLLSSPFFPSISFFNPLFNSTTTIKANNWGGSAVYVSNVTVNGIPWPSTCFLDWSHFSASTDTTIELTLTDDDSLGCGEGADALPPSLSTGGFD
ncbi:glycoside hydrolase family 92 protein [Collybiopsis luxurians FD-317 M1]|uniref:Glycoside hydrolase family 92 protein n=1 Tax=Collybiopsis luxurians FD-317 M1 TaxID=944289 RepID=A0A0D0CS74_9AGAR|nr:glycoside hydrolase family 92 protein [Collybiopsis luxurians FD-317 M1]